MTRMKKIGVGVLGAAALAFLGLAAVEWVAGSAVEDALGSAFGTPASVESVELGVFSGEVAVEGMMVANPEGFDSPHFLALADTRARAGLGELWGDTVTIRKVTLRGLEVFLERKGARTNFSPVLEQLQSEGEDEPEGARRYRIEELVLEDVVARLRIGSGASSRSTSVEVPEIRLEDVGTGPDGALPLSRVAGAVVRATLEGVMRRSGGLPSALGSLQGELDAFGSLPGSARIPGGAGEESEGVAEKAKEKLEGVLPGGG